LTIARNAFREAVRDRVLYNLVLFVLLLTASAIFLGELSAAQGAKIIVDLGLSAMLLFGTFIAIFVGTGLVYKEIERRTLYAILSKPVGRGEFLVGKYLGLCLTLAVNVLVMGAGCTLALLYVRRGLDPLALKIWPAVALIYLELLIIVAVALLFSSFSSPALSALMTFAVFVIGHFSADLKTLAATNGTRAARLFFGALFYLLPNLSHYTQITDAGHALLPPPAAFVAAVAYALVYTTAVVAAQTQTEELYLRPATVRRMSLGFNGLAADWYWLRALQYVGRKLQNYKGEVQLDDMRPVGLNLLAPLLDSATTLDPQFLPVYEYGAVVLPAVDVDAAINLVKKGIAANPTAWRLYHHLGYIYWQRGRFTEAAEAYRQGAQVPGAPTWMSAMAAQMASEGGSRATAREIYRRMFEQ